MLKFFNGNDKDVKRDVLGWILIAISSVLLGIWAVKGTIALRNTLLGIGALISIKYIYQFLKNYHEKIPLKFWMPLILLGLMFCWVIAHYVFFSRFPGLQVHELTSTWLRSGLAVMVGLATGLALQKRPSALDLLWMGMVASFAFLFYEYIPKAMAASSLFAPDYFNYIFYGKISGVLAGTILIAGLCGTLADTVRLDQWLLVAFVGSFSVVAVTAVLYAYVFILDTRNGIALAAILLSILCFKLMWDIFKVPRFGGIARKGRAILIFIVIGAMAALTWLGVEHIKYNRGWSSMWEDTQIAVQIEKYPQWQNPQEMGYPKNASGQTVNINNYERIAWGVAGLQIFMPENPLGVGVLKGPFTFLLHEKYPHSGQNMPSTHSAWVEIGLAYGYPGLFLILGSLITILFLCLGSKSLFKDLASFLSLGLIMLYTVGELSNQHAIEILCYLIALMASLLLSDGYTDSSGMRGAGQSR
jgi:hypothetical protein